MQDDKKTSGAGYGGTNDQGWEYQSLTDREIEKAAEAADQENLEEAAAPAASIYEQLIAAQGDGYYYLASPYMKFPAGVEAAFREINVIAGHFLMKGIKVFAPISHSHPIEAAGTKGDHDFWMDVDRPLMRGAVGIIVAQMESWTLSSGVAEEIEFFTEARRPVFYFQPYGRCLPSKGA